MHNSRILVWLAALALVGCGGGDSSFATVGTPAGTTTGPAVASVLVLSDVAAIPSDNSTNATISVYVRDASNQFLSGVPVIVTASSGALAPVVTVTGGGGNVTDVNGAAKYTLSTLGDKTNRTITITATAGAVTSTAKVNVTGSTLAVQGATSLTVGQTQAFTVTLNDAAAMGIAAAAVTVTAPANATVSSTALTTDSTGRATFNVTGSSGGTGTLTVASQGLTATTTITVASDALSFVGTTPAANALIPLATPSLFTAAWSSNGVPVVGQTITFATTRGCLSATSTATCVSVPSTLSAVTNAQGQASAFAVSTNAGGATVTATLPNGTQASRLVNFIATVPASIDVQPSIFTLAPSDTSTISAIVRDAQNNLVSGQTVSFTVNDVTGGTLSIASAATDLQGRAQTIYTAGSVPSANNGVLVTATVGAISKTVALTVARRQVFISIGTGNEISEPNTAQYKKDYVVQVTDAAGVGVKGVSLSMSMLSQRYFKGIRTAGTSSWATCYTIPQAVGACIVGTPPSSTVTLGCADEDFNRNGVLDAGEDSNSSGLIEAGNIAAVLPPTVVTDANGFALVSVYYPQEYAYYLQVTLKALAQVQGTAFSASSTFLLEGSAADFNNLTIGPPGPVSPFGKSNTCSDIL